MGPRVQVAVVEPGPLCRRGEPEGYVVSYPAQGEDRVGRAAHGAPADTVVEGRT